MNETTQVPINNVYGPSFGNQGNIHQYFNFIYQLEGTQFYAPESALAVIAAVESFRYHYLGDEKIQFRLGDVMVH